MALSRRVNPGHLGPEFQQGSGASWHPGDTFLLGETSVLTTLFSRDFGIWME